MYILLFMNEMMLNQKNLFSPLNCTAMRMRRATRWITDLYNGIMEPSGLHANQLMLLIPLHLTPGLTINQLAEFAALDRTTLTRNLKLLEDRQLIMLAPGEDQRTRVIRLTEHGEEALQTALPLWEKAQRQVVAQLGEAHLHELFGYLDKIEELPND